MAFEEPELSVVVVAYRMARELPRTLRSLSPEMQRGIRAEQYEIIVVDNGSPQPIAIETIPTLSAQVNYYRFEKAPVSPASAINFGLQRARGTLIGVMIDGARMASPGLLASALLAARLDDRPVISTLGFHLGPEVQMTSVQNGYNQEQEDNLLNSVRWSEDGYRLFDISVLAGSSSNGFFLPISESNALFMPSALWRELGGFDERFTSPGGGLVNLDTYLRACQLPSTKLIVLLGEGTFHQVHGGISTNATVSPYPEFHKEYVRLRNKDFAPFDGESLYVGRVAVQALTVIQRSAQLALERRLKSPSPRHGKI